MNGDMERVEGLIGRIAEDRAAQVRAIGRAAIVLAAIPEWAQSREIEAWFGIPRNRLVAMVVSRRVAARKFDAADPRSVTIYRVADVRRAIDALPDYADWLAARAAGKTAERNQQTENK